MEHRLDVLVIHASTERLGFRSPTGHSGAYWCTHHRRCSSGQFCQMHRDKVHRPLMAAKGVETLVRVARDAELPAPTPASCSPSTGNGCCWLEQQMAVTLTATLP